MVLLALLIFTTQQQDFGQPLFSVKHAILLQLHRLAMLPFSLVAGLFLNPQVQFFSSFERVVVSVSICLVALVFCYYFSHSCFLSLLVRAYACPW
jgi:hypothetical protein